MDDRLLAEASRTIPERIIAEYVILGRLVKRGVPSDVAKEALRRAEELRSICNMMATGNTGAEYLDSLCPELKKLEED